MSSTKFPNEKVFLLARNTYLVFRTAARYRQEMIDSVTTYELGDGVSATMDDRTAAMMGVKYTNKKPEKRKTDRPEINEAYVRDTEKKIRPEMDRMQKELAGKSTPQLEKGLQAVGKNRVDLPPLTSRLSYKEISKHAETEVGCMMSGNVSNTKYGEMFDLLLHWMVDTFPSIFRRE